MRNASSTRRYKSLAESYSVLRKAVSHAALCSMSRRDRAALKVSLDRTLHKRQAVQFG